MLSRFERAVECMVEGSVAGAFRLRVQPAEIGRRLERAMLERRVKSVGATLGPNAFEVRLHPDDAASFADWSDALCQEMETWLAELAFQRGILTVAPIRVQVVSDPTLRRRAVAAIARFDNTERVKRGHGTAAEALPILRISPMTRGFERAFLLAERTTVGRAEENDFVVPYPEVSRHHARLDPGPDGWQVVDLHSTNGTWLNGERVDTAPLRADDRLSFAGVRFSVDAA